MDPSGHLYSSGDVIEQRFRVVRALGSGGMGQVYLAERLDDGEKVALKMLLPELLGNTKSLARFEREVKSTKAVDHPNVLRIFEFLRLEPTSLQPKVLYIPCLVMEYLEGESVADLIEREGPLANELAASIIEQMAAALEAAHGAGIVHRDLKPDNVFLVPHAAGPSAEAEAGPGMAPGFRVVLTDFGVARRRPHMPDSDLSGDSLTASNVVVGTPEFMAPELLELEDALPASDIYALGLVAYQMVTGKLPFDEEQPLKALFMRVREPAPSPRELRPDLDETLAHIIETCLQRAPQDRFASAADIVAELSPDEQPSAVLPALHPQLPAMTRDHYLAIGIGAVMILLVVALVVLFADPGVA